MLSGIESQRAAVLLTADETFKERLGTDEHDVRAHSREPVERQNARSEDRCTTLADDDDDSSGGAQQHDGTALGDETCLCASVHDGSMHRRVRTTRGTHHGPPTRS